MNENFNPNIVVGEFIEGLDEGFVGKDPNLPSNMCDCFVPDVDASLITVLANLPDGKVAVVGDIVVIRAGPDTYHPVKSLKGLASESDVILLSRLPKAPTTPEATEVVRSALQAVLVRAPCVTSHVNASPARGGVAGMTPSAADSRSGLRGICPSAHAVVVDAKLLRAFPSSRARMILAGLSPLPPGTPVLPTVVAGVDGHRGRCFMGQRAEPGGFSTFSIRWHASESGEALRVDELVARFGGHAHATARALYDLSGVSNGDILGGCTREGTEGRPFARLATEWSYSSDTTRVVGSPPPPSCSSILLVGGGCPLSSASLALRRDIEILHAAATGAAAPVSGSRKDGAKGPFGRGRVGYDDISSEERASEEAELARWEADLEVLLSGSENMAELARKTGDVGDGDGGVDGSNSENDVDGTVGSTEEFTGDLARQDETGSEEDDRGGGGGAEQASRFRGDLDFSELLWELAARAVDVNHARKAFSMVFDAVKGGQMFPVIRRINHTAIGRYLREGVAMAREARYRDAALPGPRGGFVSGQQDSDPTMEAWRQRGFTMLATYTSLADVFLELGLHKVVLDVFHWFETQTGVMAADIERALPVPVRDTPSAVPEEGDGEGIPRDQRVERLCALADALDLVALATSCGAPWRQIRTLTHSALATLGRRGNSDDLPRPTPSAIFPIVLPKPIPPGARSKLAHPVFWELLLEPASNGEGVIETVSYAMATPSLFKLGGIDEPPVLSLGAARAAQAALEGCPRELIPEVLSCIAGVQSFVELKRRQQALRARASAAWDHKHAVFVCEHVFTPLG